MASLRRRRPLLRAAAVGAYAARRRSSAPPGTEPTAAITDPIRRLWQLGTLHTQGVLNDEEFAQQKARILGAD